jgi:hypothetical protein
MKTITSVSGGKTSAYLAANFKSDYLLFALVRIEDEGCRFPDESIRKLVEDKIQAPFVGTAEDNMIVYTILDLEQYLGQPITWVSGITYDQVLRQKGGWLPNKLHRYCTTWLKLDPMFQWWRNNINEPVKMQIGFRSNEASRADSMNEKLNENGLLEYKAVIGQSANGRNKWSMIEWQKPSFPLVENGILKHDIVKFWEDKPVRFADYNNCVGCFHRSPLFLAKMYDAHPDKMKWFEDQENGRKRGTWRSDIRYEEIKKFKIQRTLSFDDLGGCASGYCEVA